MYSPIVTDPCGPLARFVGRAFLRSIGWKVAGELPPFPKFVALGAPHTSNWDLPIVLASAAALGIRLHWMGKSELFGPATGWLFRALGGISIDRTAPQGLVEQLAGVFAATDRMVLMVPPEGTRARKGAWKSGFYHIALAAGVPVVATYADFARKQSGIAGFARMTGDVRADMDAIRALYVGITPRYPEQMTPIRLEAEDREDSSAPAAPREALAQAVRP
jgi:1-acyl-sn-glycerol-3-phosphate acyltransferase